MLSYRIQERRVTEAEAFPRWITVPSVLIVGFMLWMGALSDPSGKLTRPGLGSIFYAAALIGVAVFLACADRNQGSSRDRKFRPGYRGRRNGAVK